ncbi:MAG: periplasmic heavy metal sensor [Chlorobiaceae bacterium]|nr:periplasmic heavy metal sensor [Chlorobiaceae bacterium]
MDFLSSRRFITATLIVLVLLNITLMGVLWWKSYVTGSYQSVEMTRYYNGSGAGGSDLVLTEKQKTVFNKLRDEHFQKSKPSIKRIIALKKELIAESVKPLPDKKKISAIADSIGKRQAWLENDLATHFHELSEHCTPAQRESLEKMLGNIYTVRYQKMSSWRNQPHKIHHELKHFPPSPPPPPNH